MYRPSTFAERLKTALDIKGMTKAELSRLTGISRSSLTRYAKGDWEGKQDAVYAIAKALNLNEAWLMGYDVPMDRIDMEALLEAAKKSGEEDRSFLKSRTGLILDGHDIGCVVHCRDMDECETIKEAMMNIVKIQIADQCESIKRMNAFTNVMLRMTSAQYDELMNYAMFISQK